jgi:hypothetical protein
MNHLSAEDMAIFVVVKNKPGLSRTNICFEAYMMVDPEGAYEVWHWLAALDRLVTLGYVRSNDPTDYEPTKKGLEIFNMAVRAHKAAAERLYYGMLYSTI